MKLKAKEATRRNGRGAGSLIYTLLNLSCYVFHYLVNISQSQTQTPTLLLPYVTEELKMHQKYCWLPLAGNSMTVESPTVVWHKPAVIQDMVCTYLKRRNSLRRQVCVNCLSGAFAGNSNTLGINLLGKGSKTPVTEIFR